MGTGDAIFMAVVVGVAILVSVLGKKVPYWLGFVLMGVASLVGIIGGAATGNYRVIPLAIGGLIGTAVAWISGATSEAQASDDTLGGFASRIPFWAFAIIFVVFVGGAVASFVIPVRA